MQPPTIKTDDDEFTEVIRNQYCTGLTPHPNKATTSLPVPLTGMDEAEVATTVF